MLVSDTVLVLCNAENQCLKLVDINRNIIKAVLTLPSGLCGVTAISNDKIAVVGGIDNEIQIISVHDSMTIDRTIKTTGACVDVKMLNNHLYLLLWRPTKFQILRPTGTIIKTINPDGDVFKDVTPSYIAVSPDETVIYISDWKTNKVLSLDMNGRILALYNGELEYPHDMFISPCGSVYVCSNGQDVVYKMNSDLSEALVILGPGDGLMRPTAMCLNTNNQHFYISSGSSKAAYCNNIKFFKY
jgi:DNA-binding beta-propeller fold protein YncE